MTQPLTLSYFPIEKVNSQDIRLWDQIYEILKNYDKKTISERELKPIFDTLPDNELLEALEKTRWTGRRGYSQKAMWHSYIAMTVLNYKTFSQLIRELQNNPTLASACGIRAYRDIPSKFAYSRFLRKLSQPRFVVMV